MQRGMFLQAEILKKEYATDLTYKKEYAADLKMEMGMFWLVTYA